MDVASTTSFGRAFQRGITRLMKKCSLRLQVGMSGLARKCWLDLKPLIVPFDFSGSF